MMINIRSHFKLYHHLLFVLSLSHYIPGGWFPGSSIGDVSICKHIARNDQRQSFLHNATCQVWYCASTHSEPNFSKGTNSCSYLDRCNFSRACVNYGLKAKVAQFFLRHIPWTLLETYMVFPIPFFLYWTVVQCNMIKSFVSCQKLDDAHKIFKHLLFVFVSIDYANSVVIIMGIPIIINERNCWISLLVCVCVT